MRKAETESAMKQNINNTSTGIYKSASDWDLLPENPLKTRTLYTTSEGL